MQLAPTVLDYLHDADLHGVRIDFVDDERTLTFEATFHPDCGNPDLNGKRIEGAATGVRLVLCKVIGNVANQEEVNGIDWRVSDEAREQLPTGAGEAHATEFTLFTHSGSSWEVVCSSLRVRSQ